MEQNKYPKISIVTPSFNQAQFLEETILSVINQNYPNLEYIIIDGGSTDGSVEIIKKYEKHMTYWVSEPDKGQSHAINKGLLHCTGDIFNWLNSDDYLEEGALLNIADAYKQNRFNVLCGYCKVIDEKSKKVINQYRLRILETLEATIFEDYMNQPGTFYRLAIIKEFGCVNETLHYIMDLELWIRYLCKYGLNNIFMSYDILANFRIHDLSKTSVSKVGFSKETRAVYNYLIQQLELPYWIKNLFKDSEVNYIPINFSVVALKDENVFLYWARRLFEEYCRRGEFWYAKQAVGKIFRAGDMRFIFSHIREIMVLYFIHNNFVTKVRKKYPQSWISVLAMQILVNLDLMKIKNGIKVNKKKKQILFVQPYFISGGAEKVNMHIAQSLESSILETTIIATNPSSNEWLRLFKTNFTNAIDLSSSKYKEDVLKKIVSTIMPDIYFICHSSIGYKLTPYIKKNLKSVKVADIFHTKFGFSEQAISPYLELIDRRIVTSDNLSCFLSAFYNKINPDLINRIEVIKSGVDVEYFSPVPKTYFIHNKFDLQHSVKIVGIIGRLSKEKRPDLFVKIAEKVMSKDHNFCFIICGSGNMELFLIELIEKSAYKDRIRMLGLFDDVKSVINECDITLLTSEIEGLPMSIMESMAMGKPVISINVGAIDEIIDNNKNGYLVEESPQVMNDFSNKILDLVYDTNMYNKFSISARQKMEKDFNLRLQKEKYNNFFKNLIDD